MLRSTTYAFAFTLIEIMIVVSIIGIMATVVGINVRDSSAQSRDAQRQADLRNLQVAIEMYKKDNNGQYPLGCNAAGTWSGQVGSDVACNPVSKDYIVGLAPKYIKALPFDEKLNGTDSGFRYVTNTARTVYKIKAHRTVESETVTFEHPLKACDIRVSSNASGNPNTTNKDPRVIGYCGGVPDGTGNYLPPESCNTVHPSGSFSQSYALWGGQAPLREIVGYGVNVYASDPLENINGSEVVKNQRRNIILTNTTDII